MFRSDVWTSGRARRLHYLLSGYSVSTSQGLTASIPIIRWVFGAMQRLRVFKVIISTRKEEL